MEPGKQKVAFWLMPAADAKAVFTSLINDLAQRFEAPAFEPHVTLQSADIEDRNAIGLLERIAETRGLLHLQVDRAAFSDKYTKTLYVQFRPSEEATELSNAIARFVCDNGYEFDPHLSLLYKTMSRAAKEELAREIKVPDGQVSFDAIKLVHIPREIRGPDDVHAWRTIAERRLTGTCK